MSAAPATKSMPKSLFTIFLTRKKNGKQALADAMKH
jgi:hypothetical protein